MPAWIRAKPWPTFCLLLAAARAQRPPPFSVPDVVPEDLQINGEWWFYSLLDSQFPHDVLTPLPASAVAIADASQGTPTFVALPEAEYILLEFFAPWCPHCQHFAPEMVKLVKTLNELQGAGGKPLIAVQTVDCEKLDMAALCNWANANMMPRLVFAKKEVLLAQLGPSATETPGIQELFPVNSAQDTLIWLQQQVPGWPQSLPTPEPMDENAPFFGWSQPAQGAAEPPQVPGQDLDVAIVSLLHQAFSSLDYTPERRTALFDLLELLCNVGPGGSTCRQSACQMHSGLQQQWGALIQEVTVTHTAQGDPMPPTTFHYLDWADVEREHRWCNRPWPDFAEESWSWCRGRTPGTRGYTCGLWLLFHGLMQGAVSAEEAQQPALPKAPLEVVRSTVSAFFGCADCRQHFLEVPVTDEDLATPRAQALWLWNAHNLATARISALELKHSASAPPREQWPSLATCPKCRVSDGTAWDTNAVYEHLRGFYGSAFAVDNAKPQAGLLGKVLGRHPPGFLGKLTGKYEQLTVPMNTPISAKGFQASVEVYYYTLCPHCEYFLKLGLMPLIEAQLPGSQVQVTVLPIYPPLLRWVDDRSQCLAREDCLTALAPLCALKAASQPGPADSLALLRGSRFAVCDISFTASGQGRDPTATRGCAETAGLAWNELQGCAEGPEAATLLQSGSRNLMSAMDLLHFKTGFQDPPSMPWVFLNGDLLLCDDGKTCTAVQTPAGEQPLPASGSLLSLVCSSLNPQPPGCLNADALAQAAQEQAYKDDGGKSAERRAVKRAQECENCVEMGAFRWHSPSRVQTVPISVLALVGVALSTLALWRCSWQCAYGGRRTEEAEQAFPIGTGVE